MTPPRDTLDRPESERTLLDEAEARSEDRALPSAPQAEASPSRPREAAAPLDEKTLRAIEREEKPGWAVGFLGGASRKGRWDPPARLRVVAFMGGVELDFREARMLEGETIVEAFALMGGASIVVPPDIAVRTQGIGFMGSFDSTASDPEDRDAPLLTIRGFAMMGGVEVKVKPIKRKKGWFR